MKWPSFCKKISVLWQAKLIFIYDEKKVKGQRTPPKILKKGQKSTNKALEILKYQCAFRIYIFLYEKLFFSKEGGFLKLFFQNKVYQKKRQLPYYDFLCRIVAKFKASLLLQFFKL